LFGVLIFIYCTCLLVCTVWCDRRCAIRG